MINQVRVGVAVFILKDNKVLLGQRIGSHGENTWATPGGHLEYGESIEQCAKREVMEETKLNVKSVKQLNFTNDMFEKEGKHYITLYVLAECDDAEPVVAEPEKCLKWQWFEIDNLPSPLFLSMQNLLKQDPNLRCLYKH